MKTPPITAAQIISALAVAAAVALSHAGWMTTDQFFGVCAVAGLHIGGDAVIRNGRAQIAAAQQAHATVQLQTLAKDAVDKALPGPAPVVMAPPPATA